MNPIAQALKTVVELADPKVAVGYIRVSNDTDVQALGTEAQRIAIQSFADSNGITLLNGS